MFEKIYLWINPLTEEELEWGLKIVDSERIKEGVARIRNKHQYEIDNAPWYMKHEVTEIIRGVPNKRYYLAIKEMSKPYEWDVKYFEESNTVVIDIPLN